MQDSRFFIFATGIENSNPTIDDGGGGNPADSAAAVAYLASDDAAFVQGASLIVDGGRLSRW